MINTARRSLKFVTADQLIAEVDRLHSGTYQKLGKWSLEQACRHLALTIEMNLTPPPTDEPTAEQSAAKKGFFDMVLGPAGMPDNLPLAPALVPPDTCDVSEIDHLKTALKSLGAYPHRCIQVGKCGPVPTDEVRVLHLVHAAHHLGFLVPNSTRRKLNYANVDAAIADVQLLRRGYTRFGNWTLPQACRHLAIAIRNTARLATEPATPTQLEMRPMLDQVLAGAALPSGIQAPAIAIPPADCGDADIDDFITSLEIVKHYALPSATHRLFGPLTPAEYQRLSLVHCGHHLGHFAPTHN